MDSYGGMILTGENQRTRRQICPSVTLLTTYPTRTDPGTNPGIRGKRSATLEVLQGRNVLISTSSGTLKCNANLCTSNYNTKNGFGAVKMLLTDITIRYRQYISYRLTSLEQKHQVGY
jgi:hypothetical protein